VIVSAVLLVIVAWLAACAETAIARISRFRAEDALRSGRKGAANLLAVASDPTRYLNVALLVRVGCETAAAVLITVVCDRSFDRTWQVLAVAIGVMVLVSYVAVGV
jgi:Mg2+/Co2+ transporter CorB